MTRGFWFQDLLREIENGNQKSQVTGLGYILYLYKSRFQNICYPNQNVHGETKRQYTVIFFSK